LENLDQREENSGLDECADVVLETPNSLGRFFHYVQVVNQDSLLCLVFEVAKADPLEVRLGPRSLGAVAETMAQQKMSRLRSGRPFRLLGIETRSHQIPHGFAELPRSTPSRSRASSVIPCPWRSKPPSTMLPRPDLASEFLIYSPATTYRTVCDMIVRMIGSVIRSSTANWLKMTLPLL